MIDKTLADQANIKIDEIVKYYLFEDDTYSGKCYNGMILLGILDHVKSRIIDTLKKESTR